MHRIIEAISPNDARRRDKRIYREIAFSVVDGQGRVTQRSRTFARLVICDFLVVLNQSVKANYFDCES